MDLDCIPTIESLLEQNAICFTGRPDLINRYLVLMDLIIPIETMALLDEIGSPFKSFEWNSYPIYGSETKNSKVKESPTLDCDDLSLKESITLPNRPLYTVHLDEDFTVTAHVRCNNGYFDKLIHQKIGVNPKRLTHSLKAVTRAIDQSPAFFICTKCNKLIDANFKSQDGTATCAYSACGRFVGQHFDVLSDKVTSSLYNKDISIDIFNDYIAISIGLITWPHPHEPSFEWVIQRKMALSSTPRQVKSAAKAIHDSKIARGKCKHCNESMNAGHMFDDDTCQSCATGVYGVVY